MNRIFFLSFYIIIFCLLITSCRQPEDNTLQIPPTDWTVMIYSAGDCNLSQVLMEDLAEIKSGTNNNMTVIALADTKLNRDTDFCEAFSGTRLYKIYSGFVQRLSGADIMPEITLGTDCDLNTGDPDTFRRFIRYCKTYFPADKYAVFVGGHGKGAIEDIYISRSDDGSSQNEPLKAMAADNDSGNDWIFTAELTDAFPEDEPIDLLVLDCCNMGFAETAYQYRPGNNSFNTQYIVASLPKQIGAGLCYNRIFSKVSPTMSATDFGKLILQEQYEYECDAVKSHWQYLYTEILSMAMYDCNKAEDLKNAIDNAVPELADKDNIAILQRAADKSCGYWEHPCSIYKYEKMYDIYNLFNNLSDATNDLSDAARDKCRTVAQETAEMVISSYLIESPSAVHSYPFEPDKCGLAIVCPYNKTAWNELLSYNAIDIVNATDSMNGYGRIAWCIDGCTPSNNIAENWFELLDSWYDTTNDAAGGQNCYQY